MRHVTLLTLTGMFVAGAAALAGAQQPTTRPDTAHRNMTRAATPKRTTKRQEPRISKDSAQTIALARVKGGTVATSELEHHRGRPRYAFDISQPGKSGVEEVTVDGMSGKVVSMKHESKAREHKEMQKNPAGAYRDSTHMMRRDTSHMMRRDTSRRMRHDTGQTRKP